ncbi:MULTISPECIES: DUF6517 family protein [Haloarcula]|uniref:DUF6517 family protein n=1 Tax=Haloarcula TaxID=2237 RepID=UPI0023EC3A2A|nr:DUF6517 family protein [Halomicroarcula sp. XH51]
MDWRALALALAGALVLAGCGGASDRVVASGSPAAVEDAALAATGYERVSRTNRTLNTTVRATISGDVEMDARRSVTAGTRHLVGYVQATYAVESLERRSTTTVTVLGNETTARTSTGPATLDRDRVRRLLAGVTH